MLAEQEQKRTDKQWSGKTGGTRWMQRSLIGMFRHFNPRRVYPVVWFWILGYICFGRAGRKGIWHYWTVQERRSGERKGWWWKARNLYLNYLEFGKVILDRFGAYAGREIQVRIEGREMLDQLAARPEGFILLGTHIGNQELAGYTFPMPKPFYVLIHMGDTETVNENRRQLFESMGMHIIPVRRDGSHVLEMYNALSDGNILSVHADRMFTETRSITAPLFGEPARFPEGPFRIAVAEHVPVVTLFMMRETDGTYTLYARQLSDGTYSAGNRQENVRQLLDNFIRNYEEMLTRYPRQWFHFYEFFNI